MKSRFQDLCEVILLGCLWGPAFLFIKIIIREMHPIAMVAVRLTLAALLFWVILKCMRRSLPPFGKIWLHFLAMSLTSAVVPFYLFGFAEQHISSALAGIINGSVPIFTALFAHFLIPTERITFPRFIGVAVGCAGLAVLLWPHLNIQELSGDTLGVLAVIGASICYAIGLIYARTFLKALPPLVAPAAQLLCSALVILALCACLPHTWPTVLPSWGCLAAIGGLTLLSTVLAFILYYRILMRSGPTTVAMATYLFPLISTLLGACFLNEKLSWNIYLAGSLILAGMIVVNEAPRLSKLWAYYQLEADR